MSEGETAKSSIDQPKRQHLNVGHLREDRNLEKGNILSTAYMHAYNLNNIKKGVQFICACTVNSVRANMTLVN